MIISSYEAKPVKEKKFTTIKNGIDDDIYSDIVCERNDDENGMESINSGGFDEDDGSIITSNSFSLLKVRFSSDNNLLTRISYRMQPCA